MPAPDVSGEGYGSSMSFFAKGISQSTSGVGGRTLLRAAVLAALACPLPGCAGEIGAAPDEAEDLGAVDSTSQELQPSGQRVSAISLGCAESVRKVALQSLDRNCYVTAEQSNGGAMVCNRTSVGAWEKFEVTEITYHDSANRIALKSNNGLGPWVSATNGGGSSIFANRSGNGDWESFSVVTDNSPTLGTTRALQAISGHYVTRERGSGSVLNANRTGIGDWEKFRVLCLPGQ